MAIPDFTTTLKRCPQCGQEFPATTEFFHRNRCQPDGFVCQCKSCSNAKNREWKRANREKVRDYQRRYRLENLDKFRVYSLRYQHSHPDRIRAFSRRYRRDNIELLREKGRVYVATHPTINAAQRRNYLARKRAAEGTHTAADIQAQLKRQKRKCYWCGCKLDKYHVDHVIPLSRGGWNDPSNLVIACPRCNDSKGAKLPHEWDGNNGRLF